MYLPQASKIEPVKIELKPVCHFFWRNHQIYWRLLKLNLAEETKWHTTANSTRPTGASVTRKAIFRPEKKYLEN